MQRTVLVECQSLLNRHEFLTAKDVCEIVNKVPVSANLWIRPRHVRRIRMGEWPRRKWSLNGERMVQHILLHMWEWQKLQNANQITPRSA